MCFKISHSESVFINAKLSLSESMSRNVEISRSACMYKIFRHIAISTQKKCRNRKCDGLKNLLASKTFHAMKEYNNCSIISCILMIISERQTSYNLFDYCRHMRRNEDKVPKYPLIPSV